MIRLSDVSGTNSVPVLEDVDTVPETSKKPAYLDAALCPITISLNSVAAKASRFMAILMFKIQLYNAVVQTAVAARSKA
jgi:hypothetical protein